MRTLSKSMVLSAAFLLGAALAANADAQYRPPPGSQLSAVPSMAPPVVAPSSRTQLSASWYYDPYAHGAAACPQGNPEGGPKCTALIPPTYPAR